MRHDTDWGRARTLLGEVLPGGDALYSFRCGSCVPLSLGDHPKRPQENGTGPFRDFGDVCLHRNRAGRLLVHLEKRRARLGTHCVVTPTDEIRACCRWKGSALMALTPAVTDLEQLKGHPAISRLISWNAQSVEGVKFDRDEMTIYVDRSAIREACALLRDDANCPFNYLSDITCVDWHPSEPRFEVIYHLLSIPNKERVRLKVRLSGETPALESVTSVWPGANYFEREIFDLFGIRFSGHPYLRRLLMPENWEGHPLRKDYPVEGYR